MKRHPKHYYAMMRDFFAYDPETGIITAKSVTRDTFTRHGLDAHLPRGFDKWNARNAGRVAFATPAGDATIGRFMGSPYRSGYVAWLLGCREAHQGYIYHINGDKMDNRLHNLTRKPPCDADMERYRLGLRPTDRIDLHGDDVWAWRDNAPYLLIKHGSGSMGECLDVASELGMKVME